MAEAFLWGTVGAAALLLGAVIAYELHPGRRAPAGGRTGALVQAFAAGALLAMVADTLLPQAYAVEGVWTGTLVVIGLAISIALSAL